MAEPSGKTVLVVDDDENSRVLAGKILERQGHHVLLADNGNSALDVIAANPAIDLILIDVIMPELNGFDTVEEIRRRGLNGLPVVMLTAQSKEEELMKGYEVGADYYLTKPIQPQRLVNIVTYLIGNLPPDERAALERQL